MINGDKIAFVGNDSNPDREVLLGALSLGQSPGSLAAISVDLIRIKIAPWWVYFTAQITRCDGPAIVLMSRR